LDLPGREAAVPQWGQLQYRGQQGDQVHWRAARLHNIEKLANNGYAK
jgi:hypothetical protein